MDEERLALFLLPGMDGTGELFSNFVRLLPSWIEPHVIAYPSDRNLSYEQLVAVLRSCISNKEPFVILAESFSTPLAVQFAAENPTGLHALVLCAGFISPPREGFLRQVALRLSSALFSFGLPEFVCRRYLVGQAASKRLVDEVRAVVSRVPGRVLANRLRSVLSCDVRVELRSVSIPLLYLSGSKDRLVRTSSFEGIKQTKPEAQFAAIEAPHLILQTRPDQALDSMLPFLRNALK